MEIDYSDKINKDVININDITEKNIVIAYHTNWVSIVLMKVNGGYLWKHTNGKIFKIYNEIPYTSIKGAIICLKKAFSDSNIKVF